MVSRSFGERLGVATTKAAALIAEANVAAALALAAAFQAITARLKQLAVLGVGAGARDAAAVTRVLALTSAAQIELANLIAVAHAAARALAFTNGLTKSL